MKLTQRKRLIKIKGGIGEGKFAIIDDCDYSKIKGQRLWMIRSGYVVTYVHKKGNVYLHRLITGASKGKNVDHINHNKLDNRRSNLRICTDEQNQANRIKNMDNTSGYKGVTKNRRMWVARISIKGKLKHLGIFKEKIQAAKAYDYKAKELWGEYAHTNF